MQLCLQPRKTRWRHPWSPQTRVKGDKRNCSRLQCAYNQVYTHVCKISVAIYEKVLLASCRGAVTQHLCATHTRCLTHIRIEKHVNFVLIIDSLLYARCSKVSGASVSQGRAPTQFHSHNRRRPFSHSHYIKQDLI